MVSRKSRHFVYYQPNGMDLKDHYGDCVIRSLTKAVGKTWIDVFDELVPIARKYQCMPNSDPCYKEYLASNGFEYCGVSNRKGVKRPTVESFAKEHPDGVYVLRVANHLVAVRDGKFHDTWDCGGKSLYGYYEKV